MKGGDAWKCVMVLSIFVAVVFLLYTSQKSLKITFETVCGIVMLLSLFKHNSPHFSRGRNHQTSSGKFPLIECEGWCCTVLIHHITVRYRQRKKTLNF